MRKYCFLLLTALLCGCIPTDDLDLKRDVDIAISFSGDGLCLDGGNGIEVPMSQIVELKEDGNLTTDADGNYLFCKKSDGTDTTTICIGQGSLCEGTDDAFRLPLVEGSTIVFTPNKRFPDYGTARISGTFRPTYIEEKKKTSIKELSYVTTPMSIVVDVNLQDVDGIEAIEELRFTVPGFYDLADERELTQKFVTGGLSHTHVIHVKGVNFKAPELQPDEFIGFSADGNYIEMAGNIGVECVLGTMSFQEFRASRNPVMNVRVMIGTMGTTLVRGKFNKNEDVNIAPISLDNLPEFLRGREVELDIENPVVRLTLDNEIPASVELNAEITASVDNETTATLNVGRLYGTQRIAFDGGRQSSIWISRMPIASLPDSVKENVVVSGIGNFMRRVPDKVMVTAYANTNEDEEIELSLAHEYKVLPSYEFYAPIKMGPDMRIVYDKDMENLGKSLSHIEADIITLSADVTNNIPLFLSLSATAYDARGRRLEGVSISMPQDIPPMESRKLTFEIRSATGRNAIKAIDCIKLKATATVTTEMVGSYLNVSQNLKLDNVKLTIKGAQ